MDGKARYVTRTGEHYESLVLSYVSDILLHHHTREIDRKYDWILCPRSYCRPTVPTVPLTSWTSKHVQMRSLCGPVKRVSGTFSRLHPNHRGFII